MIRLEYDVPTSGVRISFVLRDSHMSLKSVGPINLMDFVNGGTSHPDGSRTMPQNKKNLEVLQFMLNYLQSEAS